MADTPNRRWYQYSLRSLFVLTTLVAACCSWYAYEMNEAAKRRAAIMEINKLGGMVSYYDASQPQFGGEPQRWYSWLRKTHGDKYLGRVVCVDLAYCRITDAELTHLQCLTNLEELSLADTRISDAGLANLEALTNIKHLQLENTAISDAGLVSLKSFRRLIGLGVSDTQITDAGLVHLNGLTQLEGLDLFFTQVTDKGVANLQEALPNCEIWHDNDQ